MSLNLYVSPAKLRMAFEMASAKSQHLELVMPIEGESVDPSAAVIGTVHGIDLFALHLAAMITGDALSAGGEGFPTVVDTQELIEIYGMIRDSQIALGDRRRLTIPVAF